MAMHSGGVGGGGTIIDPNMLPIELQVGPLPLIGFFGLDIMTNTIHKTIWDAFSANRKIERTALNFKLLPFGTEFPVAKPKTRSYEWYHPKGILKRNWLTKHLNILPSVVVLFENLEWSDPQWTEKQLQCASHVQSIKNSLQGRNTQLIVVLIQRGSGGQSTQNDDLLSSERAANLTSMCDINAKLLFVLPYMDQHLMNYILRLESAFHEHSQVYYTQMVKQIRSHRDQLTSSHQGLMVRHQFKLGIISELKQDFNTALKHYKQGYNFLEEIRIVDTNCMEIKTVAGFFNYKICKLMFKLNMPRDAITHFKSHIEKYKSRTGFRELQFEHYAWLSVQYQAFAELFCEAIRNGLPALQTQHPGKYYYKAAEYIGKRKDIYLQCLEMPQSPVDLSPQSNGTSSVLNSEFWGVRGMKTTSEGTSESIIIRLIQEQEKSFNHSSTIITLLGQAMAQYKVYKCLRFRKKLAVEMAEEYLKCGDYPKALTLYSLMLSDYRADKWYTIFTEILLKTLRSAYLAASSVDFIACSIEALSPNILIEKNERIQILENLWKVFQGVPPVSQQQLVPELKSKWETTLETLKSPVLIDLDKISDVLDCKITFNKAQIKCDETYQLYLFVRNNTDVPLKVRKFTVVLYDSKSYYKIYGTEAGEYTKRWETLRPMSNDILLEPDKCYKIVFQGDATQLVENIEIQIVKIELEMGAKNWAVMTQSQSLNKTKEFKSNFLQRDCLDLISVINSCYVTPTFHLNSCTKQIDQHMLVNEYFQLHVNVINNFDVCLQSVGISLTIPPNLRNRVFLTSELDKGSMQKFSSHIQINIGDLPMQSNTSISYYLISLVEGSIELKQKLWYQLENSSQGEPSVQLTINNLESPTSGNEMKTLKDVTGKNPLVNNHDIKIEYLENGAVKKIKEDSIVVNCVEEFNFIARFFTLSRQALMRAYKNEDFVLRINLNVKSPLEIEILELLFISDHNITECWHKNNSKSLKRKYRCGRTLEDILILRPNQCTNDWMNKDNFLDNDSSQQIFSPNKKSPEVVTQSTNLNTLQNSKESVENFSKNLLTTESTTSTNTTKGKPSTDSLTTKGDDLSSITGSKNILFTKTVYNNALDSLYQTQNGRNGFINQGKGLMTNSKNKLIFGIYCVRWRRAGSSKINESKFMINGVDIIDPPLNIYCYITQRVYTKVPLPFKITLKNPTTKVMYLSVTLNSSPSFMFSGHRYLNITIFSHSSYDLIFNLYPLKAGWQQLPELQLQYDKSQSDNISGTDQVNITETQQNELANLVKRWMPKWVFVHPPNLTNASSSSS